MGAISRGMQKFNYVFPLNFWFPIFIIYYQWYLHKLDALVE